MIDNFYDCRKKLKLKSLVTTQPISHNTLSCIQTRLGDQIILSVFLSAFSSPRFAKVKYIPFKSHTNVQNFYG